MSRRHGISEGQPFSVVTIGPRLHHLGRRSALVLMLLHLLITRAVALTPTPDPTPTATAESGACVGDCDRNGEVTVNELLTMVNIALGNTASCPTGDADGDGAVQITEISAAVNRALNGCPGALPTPTPDPLERESSACYESSDCFPSDVYPFRAFRTNRAFCCHLARTINGGTFSWCPAEMFDPSSLSCTQCVFPCK